MTENDGAHPLKKAFMVLLWRTQQIGQPTSLTLLAITLALQVNLYVGWRFSNTYLGVGLALTAILFAVLLAGYVWDKGLRMWHEQGIVMVERNPYAMQKLTPKEVVYLTELWIPLGRCVGGEMATKAEQLAEWCDDQTASDPKLKASVAVLMERYFEERAGSTVRVNV